MDRRKFLIGSTLALGAVGTLGLVGEMQQSLTPEQVSLLEEQKLKVMAFKKAYSENADNFDIEEAMDIFLLEEYLVSQESPISLENLHNDIVSPFKNKLFTTLNELDMQYEKSSSYEEKLIEYMVYMKKAFHLNMHNPEKPYNKDKNSIFDPMTNGRFQCRSGTKAMNYIFLSLQGDNSFMNILDSIGAKLVELHTQGHTFGGVMFKDGKIVGVDSVIGGKGVSQFGNISDLKRDKFPVNIIDSRHAFANEGIGGEILFPDKYYIVKNIQSSISGNQMKKDNLVDSIRAMISGALGKVGGSRILATEASFGSANVEEGDQALLQQDVVSYEQYSRSGGLSEGFYGSDENLSVNINNINLSAQEEKQVRSYLRQSELLIDYWNKHIILLNEGGSASQKNKLLGEILEYIKGNKLNDEFYQISKILEAHQVRLSIKSPNRMYNAIVNNFNLNNM